MIRREGGIGVVAEERYVPKIVFGSGPAVGKFIEFTLSE